MAGRGGYNTKTRQLILDYLINNRQHAVSASNILEHLEAEGASPNPTTVYRYLDKLAGEQRIMKYVADKGEKAVFQYVDEGRHCREHLHLKCVQCGRIYHLDRDQKYGRPGSGKGDTAHRCDPDSGLLCGGGIWSLRCRESGV